MAKSKTLLRLCAEWLSTVPSSALVRSAGFDHTERLAAWLLLNEETGELAAKRPEMAEKAASTLAELRRHYSRSEHQAEGRAIRRAYIELRELA